MFWDAFNFDIFFLVPAYSSAGAAAGSSSGVGGSGLYSSNYVGTGTYGPSFPYLGGFTYVGGAPGFGYGFVPPFGFGFNNDLQNFISAQFNHLQNQFNSIARLYHFLYFFLHSKISIKIFYIFRTFFFVLANSQLRNFNTKNFKRHKIIYKNTLKIEWF